MDDIQHIDSDYLKPLLTVLNYFSLTGIDILDQNQLLKFWKYKKILIISLHCVTTIGLWGFLVDAFSNGVDFLDVTVDLSYAYASVEGCLLYLHFLYSKKDIKTFVLRLGKKWRDDGSLSLDLVTLRQKKMKSLDRFNYVYFTGVAIFVHLYMLMQIFALIIRKFIFKEDVVFVLPFRLIFPINYEDNFALYALLFSIMYMLSLSLTYLINGGVLLLTVCMSQLRILFESLQDEFRDAFNSKNVSNLDEKIERAIQRHSVLLNLTRELSCAFGSVFAIHLVFLSAVICFFGVTALINGRLEDIKNLMGSIISITTIYHCCYNGQLLSDSISDVGTALYTSEWYSLSRNHQKIMLILILRSQRVTYIQSTSFTKVSLETFIKIMHMAWSLISVITGM